MSRPHAADAPGAAPPDDDGALARSLARDVGQVLLDLRASGGPDLGGRGDSAAHARIVETLARLRAGDAVLSEEGADDGARRTARRVWIVDPLDGTREYADAARPDWAVHIALWAAGDLTAAAVALPALGVVLGTDRAPSVPAVTRDAPLLAVSRSRPPALVDGLAQALGARLVPLGSAGYKVSAVIRGEADAYVHAGGQYEWDSAAPVAVARAAGLHTSRLDGTPLRYNRADPWLPDLLVCRPELADPILGHLASRPALPG